MMTLAKGKKIKYCDSTYCGKEIIKTAYVLMDNGDEYIWIADTKEELREGYGATIHRDTLR